MVLGIGNPTPTPPSRQGTPGAGIDWKMLLFVVGIVTAAFIIGMMMNEGNGITKLADTNVHSVDIGQGSGPGSSPVAVETETPERETPELTGTEEIGYTGTYYPVDNIPPVLKAARGDLLHTGFQDIYFTNLRRENGRFKFCVENRGGANGHIGAIHVYVVHGGARAMIESFTGVVVPPREKKCFVTADTFIETKMVESTDVVSLYLPHF